MKKLRFETISNETWVEKNEIEGE